MSVLVVILLIIGDPFKSWPDLIKTLVSSLAVATVVFCLWLFIRWFCCWRNFKKSLFGIACIATLTALFYAEENWRGKHDWEKFKREWEAKGVKLDYASIIPPAVPDDQNFALTPVVASCYETYFDKTGHEVKPRNTNVVDRFSLLSWRDISYENQREKVPESISWPAAQTMDLKAWQAFFRSPPPTNSGLTNSFPIAAQPQNPADDVLLALTKYDSVLEEIRQASRLPYSRFPLTYDAESKAAILLPHLAALKNNVKALRLHAVAELQGNRTELAGEDVKLGFYLVNAVRTEHFIISQLVRLSMLEIALQPVWEGLADHRWSESQLMAMDEELAKLNFLVDGQNALGSEISFAAEETDFMRRDRNYAAQFAQMGVNYSDRHKLQFTVYRLMPGGWFYQSALKNGRLMTGYLPAVNLETKTISPALTRRADDQTRQKPSLFDPLEGMRDMFHAEDFFMGSFLKRIAYAQASVNLARTGIALERYRLAHGEYPEVLTALAPEFIAQVPQDVIGGVPLKYRREANGQFVLYSVGWNETDDGGVVVFKNGSKRDENPSRDIDISQGDWAWRYPARQAGK
jgi:hypothetical protein